MRIDELKANIVVRGGIFPEPVKILVVQPLGDSIKIIGKGMQSGQVHEPVLNAAQVEKLQANPEAEPFDGKPLHFRLGIEAMRLALAYEYDPYFALSIARVDPLPHQLEAVYDYFLRLPRIRFLLADDPGAGKTIMAGLLLKELKIRGLVKRTLIVTPASLTFQWQRELKDKFREDFEIIRSDVLRANYGSNPWQDKNQVITSVAWVSRIEDAKESLLRSHWDLVIVDEAHKMAASSDDKKTMAYQLGEALSEMTDHYLLMTATPHKGDPDQFCLFLELLDRDVYGNIKSLEEAMKRNSAPFYLRRTKEALIHFPDPDTGQSKRLFTRRTVKTMSFNIDSEEFELYDLLTRYVQDQSIKAQAANTSTGRAVGFTMAMLQRRFASSVFAVRRTLERMRDKRQSILTDPEGYREEQMNNRIPDNFEDLADDEQQKIISDLEGVVPEVDVETLREDIFNLGRLIDLAQQLEQREKESKLVKLREVIESQGIFSDPKMKLLIFTEHKDTLDYLVGKLRMWGLTVTQIHGGMKTGDRDTPGTRIHAEREFRESCQIMVATEAAGEGINLQFCWMMINYDIPWNPMRLEQRMGRIHRYGQEKDCLILNFVSTNTSEGRVLHTLFTRIEQIENDLDPHKTGKVFNVLGDVFPSNQIEKMIRDMYARNLTEESLKNRIIEEIDTQRFRKITDATLEGLAKRSLNLSAIMGKSAEARERRLVPEVIEDFFKSAGPVVGVFPKEVRAGGHIYRVGRVPRNLWPLGEQLEPRFGKLGHEYQQIVFDKNLLAKENTAEWVTPGHPLFETVRESLAERVHDDLLRGAVFYDLHHAVPYRLDVFSAAVKDGRGNQLHRRLFAVSSDAQGNIAIKQPTVFLDLSPAPEGTAAPASSGMPTRAKLEQALVERELKGFLTETVAERQKEIQVIRRHVEISLKELIHRNNLTFARLNEQQQNGDKSPQVAGQLKQAEDRIEDLNHRLENRRRELDQEHQCAIGDIEFVGAAWVLPHPERTSPGVAAMVRDDDIERIAVETVIAYEKAQGRSVESVETQDRGFDLISRKPHPEDAATAVEVRFIEVKGRSGVGEIALSSNEYKTAARLKQDYWLYVVYNCGANPAVHVIRDPAKLGWREVMAVEHYSVPAAAILGAEKGISRP